MKRVTRETVPKRQHLRNGYGPGRHAVLVEQPAEPVGSSESGQASERPRGRVGDWDLEVDPAVRSFMVVVIDELEEDPLEVAFAPDEHPVEALGPRSSYEPFGDRVRPWRPHGCFDNAGADRPHHLVEGPDELGVTVADQEPDGSALVLEGGRQVTGLLGDPGSDWVGRHASQEHLPALQVDEEQHIEPSQGDRVDVEEVAREGAGGLGSKELRPRGAGRPRRRAKVVTAQDIANARRRDGHAELAALAHDAKVAPAGVVLGQANYEGNDLVIQGVRRLARLRIRPGPSDEFSVPTEQRGGRDEERRPALPAEQPGQRGQQSPVRRGVPRTCHLAPEHRQLMAEDGDLDVLLVRRPTEAQ